MLKFYADSPGLAWNTDTGKWIRVDENNSILGDELDYVSQSKLEADAVLDDGKYKILHLTEYLAERTDESRATSFKSDFSSFDQKMGGLETGEIVVISGQRKNGKTLFAESWIRSICNNNSKAKAMYLSFEVQTYKLFEKYLDNPAINIYTPRSLKTMDFEWLKERCLSAKLKYGCNLLLIDHLHFMVDMNTRQNMSLNIGAFMRRLKQEISLGMDYAVILIAHQGQGKDGQSASINNIRDSSFITQESDSTVIVGRRKNFDTADLDELENKNATRYAKYCKRVMEKGEEKEFEDDYSMGLATVSIEVSRRTGCFEYKKVFQKVGNFLEEL